MFVFQFTCSLFGMARWSHFFLKEFGQLLPLKSLVCFPSVRSLADPILHSVSSTSFSFWKRTEQAVQRSLVCRWKFSSVSSITAPSNRPRCQQIGPRFLSNFAFFSEVQHPIQIRKFGEGCLIRLHRENFANTRPGQGTSWHAWVDRWRTGCLRHVDRIGPVKSVEWKSG